MTVTATLVGGQNPQLVQIVVDEAPDGETWTLTGTAGDYTWQVPGGAGIGDGDQVVRVDNRTPGNLPIVYTFTAESGAESSSPITVTFARDMVLQSMDGQITLQLELLDESLDTELPVNGARFRVPGRPRPVVRYDVTGDVIGQFRVMVPVADSNTFRQLFASGAPILYRLGVSIMDLDLVSTITITSITSRAHQTGNLRVWNLGYELVDDPFADVPLGAFTWDYVDDALAALDWDDSDAFFTGTTWDEIDRYDWSTL